MTRRLLLGLLAGAVLAAGAYVTRSTVARRHAAADTTPFPAPAPDVPAAAPALDDFAGADACAGCHVAQFTTWRASTHGRAGGVPPDAPLVAPFDGKPIRFRDATVAPVRSGATLAFVVTLDGRAPQRFDIAGVIGGAHMLGGGTQGFVSRHPDGTLRFLPFDFAKREGIWFCNTISRGGNGWVPITPDLPIAACGDWPPNRILGDDPRVANCSSCHGSRIQVRLDTTAKTYVTTVQSYRIDCESCHGPGKRHIALVRSGVRTADIGMRSLATLGKEQSVGTCLACHAVKDVLRPGYRPGAPLGRFYSVGLAQFGNSPLFPDGRVRTFAYQEGHLSSDCYVSGGMTCTDCHDPHSQRYRDVRGRPLSSPFDDRQCTACHVSKAVRVREHTRHTEGTPASACVSCHMPYLQHPELGTRIRFARSDHTVPVPRPRADADQGITSACAACHTDRGTDALEGDLRRLWGEIKPAHPLVRATAQAAGYGNPAAAASALLPSGNAPLAARLAALTAFVERYVGPDAGDLDRDVELRLLALADERDPDVRAIALATLHYAAGSRQRIRMELIRRLRDAGEAGDPALRRRWVLVLGHLADKAAAGGDPARAVIAYRKALELEPANPQLLLSHGVALAASGDAAAAIEAYRRSLAADAAQPLVHINLGLALEQQDPEAAARAYRRALELNPYEAVAYFNLANVYLRGGRLAEAIPLYERAAALDPSLANAHFYLARALAAQGAWDRALRALDDGLRFAPADADALQLREEIVRLRR